MLAIVCLPHPDQFYPHGVAYFVTLETIRIAIGAICIVALAHSVAFRTLRRIRTRISCVIMSMPT
jgi:hypothetical protein